MKSIRIEEAGTVKTRSREILLTEEETASLLNLSKRTLQAWRGRGCGPRFIKVGRSIRYRSENVQEFVNENVHQSTSEDSYRVKANVLTI